jgi:phenylpropionate dioxygenase-like ring-hydroxylating dioxygenase large terminal subunit
VTAEHWFEVAHSAGVADSKPLAVHCGGRDLVCYRGRSGQVHVVDGLCPHMRVSFARHGIIEGDGITCRYHGWNWDREGRNVWVPTQRRAMAVFDLRSYPVCETDGRVLVRLDPDG